MKAFDVLKAAGICIPFGDVTEAQHFLDHVIKTEDNHQQKFDQKKMSTMKTLMEEFISFVENFDCKKNQIAILELKLRIKFSVKLWKMFLNFMTEYNGEDDRIIRDMIDVLLKYFKALAEAYDIIEKYDEKNNIERIKKDEACNNTGDSETSN